MGEILVSGFTFIKNGITLGYPIRESIESIEPLCDEIVINIGFDDPDLVEDDGTYEYLTSYFTDSKFRFLKSYWDPNLTKDGLILSQQTNIALDECNGKFCQYIQGDEVIHEDDISAIKRGIDRMNSDSSIEGLVFDYIHFYGNVDIFKYTRNIYRREVRLIRNNLGIKSWLDAQGFRHKNNTKLRCVRTNARIMHYGWARREQVMKEKVRSMDKLYHGNDHEPEVQYEYHNMWGLRSFKGSHPSVMKKWIEEHRNDIDILSLKPKLHFDNIGLAISDFIEKISGYRIGEYKNYKLK